MMTYLLTKPEIILYIVALFAAFWGCIVLFKNRKAASGQKKNLNIILKDHLTNDDILYRAQPVQTSPQKPQVSASAQPATLSTTPEYKKEFTLLATTRADEGRICPKCDKTYPAQMVICPKDFCALEVPRAPQGPSIRLVGKYKKTLIERMSCSQCERRFVYGAIFCTYDGTRLKQDCMEEAAFAASMQVCTICGSEKSRPEHKGRCKDESCVWRTINPAQFNDNLSGPMFILSACPQCGIRGKHAQIHCKEDHTLLLPLAPVYKNALPHTGFGARQKICESCGVKHHRGAKYCAYDGEKLITMH